MNDEKALDIIQAYFDNNVTQEEYESALEYLEQSFSLNSRLADLYRDIMAPGGISHVSCQELMLLYLDPLERKLLESETLEKFLIHLTRCRDCAEEYLELASFEEGLESELDNLPHFKTPLTEQVVLEWPGNMQQIIEIAADASGSGKALVYYIPPDDRKIAEEKAPYSEAEPSNKKEIINLIIKAVQSSSGKCELSVTLENSEQLSDHIGRSIILKLDELRLESMTDQNGQATFKDIPIEKLPGVQIEFTF